MIYSSLRSWVITIAVIALLCGCSKEPAPPDLKAVQFIGEPGKGENTARGSNAFREQQKSSRPGERDSNHLPNLTTEQLAVLPEVMQRRESRISAYQDSLAKDSIECKQVLEILRGEGLDEEAVADTYFSIEHYNMAAGKYGPRSLAADQSRSVWVEYLGLEYGLTNKSALDRIFAIKPLVPWARSPIK